MDMAGRSGIPMTEAEALLRLTQWLSPAFPLGSFAYSHGLETLVADGVVGDAAALQDWLVAVLQNGAGRVDAVLLCKALDGEDPEGLAHHAAALAGSSERWSESIEQGRAFCRTVSAMGVPMDGLPLPVAVGTAAQGLGLPAPQVVALYLQAFAGALVSAGVRLIPLGQTEGQTVLAGLAPVILSIAEAAPETPLEAVGSGAFGADLAALHHETAEVRLYKS